MRAFDEYTIGDVSLDGFQPVKGHCFSRIIEPNMTLRENSISFNIAAYHALNCVASVQILVNEANRRILVRPISSDEHFAVNWIRNPDIRSVLRADITTDNRRLRWARYSAHRIHRH